MKCEILGFYDKKKDGTENVTKNGNKFWTLMMKDVNDDDEVIYDNIFCTPKAWWRMEELFAAAGKTAPSITECHQGHLDSLLKDEVEIASKRDAQGYMRVKKFYPKTSTSDVAAPTDTVTDEISGQVADDEDDMDDVPF